MRRILEARGRLSKKTRLPQSRVGLEQLEVDCVVRPTRPTLIRNAFTRLCLSEHAPPPSQHISKCLSNGPRPVNREPGNREPANREPAGNVRSSPKLLGRETLGWNWCPPKRGDIGDAGSRDVSEWTGCFHKSWVPE